MPYLLCSSCQKLRPLGTQCPCAGSRRRYAPKPHARAKGRYDYRWQKSRAAAIAAQPWCSFCGTGSDLTGDHILPLSRGGTSDPSNIRVLCRSCNSARGNR
ncbi:HNH endonuclease [Streptomyces sp. NRRL S-378]|uniref:HNH endonuclease n=1 Tax=Streptomyces sp. NRRL S-378 TaxID=1463904 RepID=UPI00099C8988